jgi:hypothetical protein
MVGKAQKSHGARSGLYGRYSDGVPLILVSASIATFHSHNADAPLRLLCHPKKGSFKTIITSWVELCKKCVACQGKYFEKETVTALPE